MAKDWTLYKTADMERAVEAMASRHKHCVLKKTYKTDAPIYIRTNATNGVPYYSWHPKQIKTNGELQRWQEHGGVLIDPDQDWSLDERIPTYDAVLWAEAPIDTYALHKYGERCRRDVVVFRPPTWNQHEAVVSKFFPTGLALDRAMDKVEEHLQEGLTAKHRQILKDLNIEPGPCCFMASDRQMAEELDVDTTVFQVLRSKILEVCRRWYWQPLMCIIPRIEPENPAYLDLYRFFEGLPSRGNGERYCQDKTVRALTPSYKQIIRAMVREGSLEKLPYQYVWDLNAGRRPMIEPADRNHRKAVAELQFLKASVDAAPTYPLER